MGFFHFFCLILWIQYCLVTLSGPALLPLAPTTYRNSIFQLLLQNVIFLSKVNNNKIAHSNANLFLTYSLSKSFIQISIIVAKIDAIYSIAFCRKNRIWKCKYVFKNVRKVNTPLFAFKLIFGIWHKRLEF